jgi:hypothetical protein
LAALLQPALERTCVVTQEAGETASADQRPHCELRVCIPANQTKREKQTNNEQRLILAMLPHVSAIVQPF